MTDTKPSLDEQIEHQRGICNGADSEYENAKLASLEELKRIQSAEMPEPVAWRVEDEGATWSLRNDEPSQEDIDWVARWGRKYQPLYGPELLAYAQRKDAEAREQRERAERLELECDRLNGDVPYGN